MPTLLLIEDNQHIQRVFREKFKREGFEVVTADTGLAGLRAARDSKPEAILLDIMLPVLDGFETLKRLHADPELGMIPVFMLSNRASMNEVQYALSLGARKFYAKGSNTLQEIVSEICSLCNLRRVVVAGTAAEHARAVAAQLRHPQLLCSEVAILAELIGAVNRQMPELIVLDCPIPTPTIFGLVQQLKAGTETRSIPILAITADPASLQRADAFLRPERVPTDLRRRVLQLLEVPDVTLTASR